MKRQHIYGSGPDVAERLFSLNIGNFSPERDMAFEKHLATLSKLVQNRKEHSSRPTYSKVGKNLSILLPMFDGQSKYIVKKNRKKRTTH